MRVLQLAMILLLAITMVEQKVEAKKVEIEKLPWEQVNQKLPRYSKFIVEDLETGKKFKVQRRAGSRHADVQPLTSKDTKIMKAIYDGKWSWKRRAIIVHSKEKKIAASMHGMPHGAGALKNNFPGHFCIHFYGSTTHRTNFMDLSHKLMILKSAGELEHFLAKSNPYDVANAYLAGLKQQDLKIVSLTSAQDYNWDVVLPEIENITVDRMAVLPVEDIKGELVLNVPVSLTIQLRGIGYRRYDRTLKLVRFTPYESWKVDSNSFLKENKISFK
ncbi:hypothetical protein [Mesobacillus maritimus]|uniref:DUF1571 domain-containing protein n=1 Tax=Mesobacillus maritimus TaxID=1643336 RepID=A0ABS7K3M0_9BACI|nr:hypothetical protein [Mesobacillus maritimus]MBY0096710.1 hypothetical protein [Mesobacillus maritimus]